MARFQAPTGLTGSPISYDTPEPVGNRLMRHFGARTVGRNVYYLTDGTVTEVDPDGTTVTWADVETVWWGGHEAVSITAAEETALTAAGYTVLPD